MAFNGLFNHFDLMYITFPDIKKKNHVNNGKDTWTIKADRNVRRIWILWRLLPDAKKKGDSEDTCLQLLRAKNFPDGFIYVSFGPLWRFSIADRRWCRSHPPPASASPPLSAPSLFANTLTSWQDQGSVWTNHSTGWHQRLHE